MHKAYAKEPSITVNLTLQDKAVLIAAKYDIDQQKFLNLIESESNWNPVADNGEDRGLTQISRTHHPEVSDECAFDSLCNMQWAASYIAENGWDEWVVCNCYLLVKTKIPELPKTADIVVSNLAKDGSVAVFDYRGLRHYAYITKLGTDSFEVIEANFERCKLSKRTISRDDPALLGYWSPLAE